MTERVPSTTDAGFLSHCWWQRLAQRIESDDEIGYVGRWTDLQLGMFVETSGGIATFVAGKVVDITNDGSTARFDAVLLTGSKRAWAAFLQPVPPRLHNDILAMIL